MMHPTHPPPPLPISTTTYPLLGSFIPHLTVGRPDPLTNKPTYLLYGHPLSRVSIAGIVTSVTTRSTSITATIDDGSLFAIPTFRWLPKALANEPDPNRFNQLACVPELGDLVTVVGQVNEYQGVRRVHVEHWAKVNDPNETMLHTLRAIGAARYLKQAPRPKVHSHAAGRLHAAVLRCARPMRPGEAREGVPAAQTVKVVVFGQLWQVKEVRELAAKVSSEDPPEFNLSNALHDMVDLGMLVVQDFANGLFQVVVPLDHELEILDDDGSNQVRPGPERGT
ncbi:hypothetical protein BCR44DRAFT_230011, partial [Catenaria anguillulae PL171]